MKSLGILGLLAAALLAPTVDITSPWEQERRQPDKSQGAMVSQVIGANDWVQITYHRPGIDGRDVWQDSNARGQRLVPFDNDPGPWRAGANEATTIEFTTNVKIEGRPLAAGRYALFMVPSNKKDWKVIFNSNPDQWGSNQRDPALDALTIKAILEDVPHAEWLTFGFDDPKAYETMAYLHWGTKKASFKIQHDAQ